MKIIRENTERAARYLAIIYPFLKEDDEPSFHMSLTVALDYDCSAPVVRGLSQFPYNRQQVTELRAALDAVLTEMNTIEAIPSIIVS